MKCCTDLDHKSPDWWGESRDPNCNPEKEVEDCIDYPPEDELEDCNDDCDSVADPSWDTNSYEVHKLYMQAGDDDIGDWKPRFATRNTILVVPLALRSNVCITTYRHLYAGCWENTRKSSKSRAGGECSHNIPSVYIKVQRHGNECHIAFTK